MSLKSRVRQSFALFLFSVFIFSLSRLVCYGWNHAQYQPEGIAKALMAFFVGLRFDLAASAWLILPVFLLSLFPWHLVSAKAWRWSCWILFAVVLTPAVIVNLVDIESVNYVGRRMTADVLFMLKEAQGKMAGFFTAFAGLMAMAIPVVAIHLAGSAWISFRSNLAQQSGLSNQNASWQRPRLRGIAEAFVLFLVLVIASRGGFQNKPISFVDANVFSAPVLNNLVLNTPFNILKSLNQPKLPRVKYFESATDLRENLNGGFSAASLLDGKRPAGPQNVVILIMESFGLEYMGKPIGQKGWTPFLDSLIDQSLFFPNAYANGRRSIEGVASILAGIPSLMEEPFISSPFTANRFVGLGTILVREGYETAFFHGGKRGTMHFDSFTKSAGISNYYGSEEYPDPNDHDGSWGIYDGPFINWMLSKISTAKEPFLYSFFSLSSHHPYLIPPAVAGNFPEGSLPILKTISYADDALKKFFEEASKQPWYARTLFVITADHTARAIDPAWENELGRHRVPILFFHPGFQWPQGIDFSEPVQHIDILPSVLDFLGVKVAESIPLARSVFVPGARSVTLQADGNYHLIAKDFFLNWRRGSEPVLYRIEDQSQKNPIGDQPDRQAQLQKRLKASIQIFSEGMWDNRLYYPQQ